MTSRFDQPAEKDPNTYDENPIDPQDEPQDGEPWTDRLTGITYRHDPTIGDLIVDWGVKGSPFAMDPPIDPAEHAAHAGIEVLTTFEQQIALCGDKDLERAHQLRQMVLRHEQQAARVTNRASAKVDEILERRR